MYKVLIVDDEPLIREGLATLIEWQEYGFEVVQSAKDGQDALEKYELYKPDLLIVDIRMPGMDGLKLIETIRQAHRDPKLLILSGYADFDYAKKAIQSKVEGYILKPVDEDELIDYLRSIRRALDRERETAQQRSVITDRHRETLIQSVVTGNTPFTDSVSSRASELSLVWKQYQVLLLLIQFDNERQVDVLSNARQKLQEFVESEDLGVVFMRDLQLSVLLRESYATAAQLQRLYQRIADIWKNEDFTFYASIGKTVYRFVDIKDSYDHAFDYMKRRFFAERGTVMNHETAPQISRMIAHRDQSSGERSEELDIQPCADKLYYALDVANKESVISILQQVLETMVEHDMSEQAVKTTCMQMLTGVLNKLQTNHEELRTQPDASAWVVQIYKYTSSKEMFAMIERQLLAIVDRLGSMNTDILMKRLIDLIDRNYQENLKLESLAEVFNYNSAYLGKLFKSHTGEYFNTYLDKVRIERAKSYLAEGLKVYQVAERVGYTNVDYFHSKFKKYTGVAPSAYRQEKGS